MTRATPVYYTFGGALGDYRFLVDRERDVPGHPDSVSQAGDYRNYYRHLAGDYSVPLSDYAVHVEDYFYCAYLDPSGRELEGYGLDYLWAQGDSTFEDQDAEIWLGAGSGDDAIGLHALGLSWSDLRPGPLYADLWGNRAGTPWTDQVDRLVAVDPAEAVPEPSPAALVGLGLAALGWMGWRRRAR